MRLAPDYETRSRHHATIAPSQDHAILRVNTLIANPSVDAQPRACGGIPLFNASDSWHHVATAPDTIEMLQVNTTSADSLASDSLADPLSS